MVLVAAGGNNRARSLNGADGVSLVVVVQGSAGIDRDDRRIRERIDIPSPRT